MARGDPLFARLEVDFILNDPRYFGLSDFCQGVYIGLWCLAVKERTERLPSRYTPRTVAQVLHKDPRSVGVAITKIQHVCTDDPLVGIDQDGRIIVYGARKKHNRLRDWKEEASPYGAHKGPNVPRTDPREEEVEEEVEEDPPQIPPKGAPRRRASKKKATTEEEFDRFWTACRWRKGSVKSTARERFEKLVAGGEVDAETLITRATNYGHHVEADGSEVQQAQTFLGPQKRAWESEDWDRAPWEAAAARGQGAIAFRPGQSPTVKKPQGFKYTDAQFDFMDRLAANRPPNRNRAKAIIDDDWPKPEGEPSPDGLRLEDILKKIGLVDEATENHKRREDTA